MNHDKEIDHDYTDFVVCPWCGYEEPDSWEYEDGDETTCNECGGGMKVETHESISYTTAKTGKQPTPTTEAAHE